MVTRFRIGRCVFAAIALVIMCFGFATPAMADPETPYRLGDTMLTAVIVGPAGTNASGDSYVFQFAGGGPVKMNTREVNGQTEYYPVSGGIKQDNTTIKEGDIVPTIPDVTLDGVAFTNENTLSNGQMSQTVVQKPLSEVLSGVTFPHAGVYTYVVTEKSANTTLTDGSYIHASKAEYVLRIYVKNANTGTGSEPGDRQTTVQHVTIEQKRYDDGTSVDGGSVKKVNPQYPKTGTDGNKIVKFIGYDDGGNPIEKTPGANELAGDTRGRNVPGFTFANEYITPSINGGAFQVKKLYDGDYSDRTKYSTVELTIHSTAAASDDGRGSVLTYRIEGDGIDLTGTNNEQHPRLDGVYGIPQQNDYMVEFDNNGWAYITADLKEDSVIRITGMFGPYDDNMSSTPNGRDKRETISTCGLTDGLTYYVIERNPVDYRPTGYVYVGTSVVDPRKNSAGMSSTTGVNEPTEITENYTKFTISGVDNDKLADIAENYENYVGNNELRDYGLCVTDTTTGSATTVFVVNAMDGTKVSVTGILIDNLPYVLMIGIPVIVFIALFALRRRRVAAE